MLMMRVEALLPGHGHRCAAGGRGAHCPPSGTLRARRAANNSPTKEDEPPSTTTHNARQAMRYAETNSQSYRNSMGSRAGCQGIHTPDRTAWT